MKIIYEIMIQIALDERRWLHWISSTITILYASRGFQVLTLFFKSIWFTCDSNSNPSYLQKPMCFKRQWTSHSAQETVQKKAPQKKDLKSKSLEMEKGHGFHFLSKDGSEDIPTFQENSAREDLKSSSGSGSLGGSYVEGLDINMLVKLEWPHLFQAIYKGENQIKHVWNHQLGHLFVMREKMRKFLSSINSCTLIYFLSISWTQAGLWKKFPLTRHLRGYTCRIYHRGRVLVHGSKHPIKGEDYIPDVQILHTLTLHLLMESCLALVDMVC